MATRVPEYKILLRRFVQTPDIPEAKKPICEAYWNMAEALADGIRPGTEHLVAMRKLLESRDAAMRCKAVGEA